MRLFSIAPITRRLYSLALTGALVLLPVNPCHAVVEDKPPETAATSLDAMVEILKAKGILTPEEATAFTRKHSGASSADGMKALVGLLQEKGVLSPEEAEGIARKQATTIPAGPGKERIITVLAPEAVNPEMMKQLSRNVAREIKRDVKEQVKEEIQQDVMEDAKSRLKWPSNSPDWVQRVRWGGDIRLRYQEDTFDRNNADLLKPDKPTELLNTKNDRQRARIRVRLDVAAQVHERVEAGVRISTGNEQDPISTNDTLGDYFNKDGIVLDRAYLKCTPVTGLTVTGGRIPNPWFYTDLVWDHDLNFEGLAATYKMNLIGERLKGFVTGGLFPLQEVELSDHDKWLYGGQLGFDLSPVDDVKLTLAGAYYSFENTRGQPNDPFRPGEKDFTAPLYQQKGNTLFDIDPGPSIKTALAADYRELNVNGQLELSFWNPVKIVVFGDYVRNLGFDREEVALLTGNPDVKEETEGWHVGMSVGHLDMTKFADWRAFCAYRHLEADACIDAFTDSDFHLGGTNTKGWILGGDFALYKNVWLTARWMTADEISGPPLAIDVLQVDLNAKF